MFKVWNPKSEKCPSLDETERSRRINLFRSKIENSELNGKIETKDIIMISCLHSRDWDVEAAFKRLTKFLKFREEFPDCVIHEHPKAYEHLLRKNMSTMLENRDKNGRRIYLINVSKNGPENDLSIANALQIHNAWLEMVLYEPETIVNGVSIILDMKDVTWSFIRWFTSSMASMASKLAGIAALRHLSIHVINTNSATATLANCVLPFTGQRIRNLIRVHNNLKTLHDELGRECLPSIYGGPETNILDYKKILENMYVTFNTHPKKCMQRMKCEPEVILKTNLHEYRGR
ncbi:alpha-tocopherol transfer protein-like [Culicoides brevitarsis]|uniref:alpha-tocopherol transfer protein-like n=1 Tax=Culicoides brevitarsis TaxID=469753 RepID=UPI00307C59DA